MANYEQVFKNIESLLNKNKVKGASFVVLNEEGILYSNQLGVSDKEKEGDIVIDQNTKFPLDKMKKLFLPIAIMQLVEKEMISLDSDIKEYLPEFSIKNRFEESKKTIKDLLENRAGIPSDDIDLFLKSNGKDYYAVFEYLKEQYLIAPPKMMAAESGIGYVLLAIIIEKITEKKYDEYLNENILKPMDIELYNVKTKEDVLERKNDITYLYNKNGKKVDERIYSLTPYQSNDYIKVSDYANMLHLLINNGKYQEKNIISAESVELLLNEPFFEDEVDGAEKKGMGLEFYQRYTKSIGKTIGLYDGKSKSSFIILKDKKLAAVAFSNTETNVNVSEKICLELLENELGVSFKLEKRQKQNNYIKCRVEDYAGMYPTANEQIEIYLGDFLTLEYGDKKYKMQMKKEGCFDLIETKKTIFSSTSKTHKTAYIDNGFLTLKEIEKDGTTEMKTVAYRIKPTEIDSEWRKALGYYRVAKNNSKDVTAFDEMELTIKKGFLFAEFRKNNVKRVMSLGCVNSNEAIILGYGDESNSTVFLSLSTIKFNGLTFVKIKESPLNKVKEKRVNEEKIQKKNHKKKINKMFDIEE